MTKEKIEQLAKEAANVANENAIAYSGAGVQAAVFTEVFRAFVSRQYHMEELALRVGGVLVDGEDTDPRRQAILKATL